MTEQRASPGGSDMAAQRAPARAAEKLQALPTGCRFRRKVRGSRRSTAST